MVENSTKTKALWIPAAAALLALAVIATLALGAGEAQSKNSKVIGPVRDVGKASCPKDCNAFGHVTGFQLRTGKQRAVHKIREDGYIVAWSLDLGTPDKETLPFFQENLKDDTFGKYGSNSVANLAILKKKQNSKKARFVLGKQSPVVQLDSELGRKPIFTLNKPLKVQKGRIVALTTPTWVTNFSLSKRGKKGAPLSSKNKWRASRKSDRCEGEDLNGDGKISGPDEIANLTKRSHPQVRKGSTKTYGCVYPNAQILYWAYFVPADGK